MAGLDLLGMLAVQGGEGREVVAMIEKLAPQRVQEPMLCPVSCSWTPCTGVSSPNKPMSPSLSLSLSLDLPDSHPPGLKGLLGCGCTYGQGKWHTGAMECVVLFCQPSVDFVLGFTAIDNLLDWTPGDSESLLSPFCYALSVSFDRDRNRVGEARGATIPPALSLRLETMGKRHEQGQYEINT